MCSKLFPAGNQICCVAGRMLYAPSKFEMEEYCLADRHRLCPLYCMSADDGVFDLREMHCSDEAA